MSKIDFDEPIFVALYEKSQFLAIKTDFGRIPSDITKGVTTDLNQLKLKINSNKSL